MTTQDELRTIAGKALADTAFRAKLLADPEAAVKEAGIELTSEQLTALKEMDKEELERGLTELDGRLTMACWGKSQGIITTRCMWR